MADMDIDEEELEQVDCSDPSCLNKYVEAGRIAQQVLEAVQNQVNVTRDVAELCQFGDELIVSKTNALFKKGDIQRGIAFPTCLSKNEIAGHFCPMTSETSDPVAKSHMLLQDGDLVKIDLGVQIDGFAALVATTFQVGGGQIPEGKKAKVMQAAYTAAECAIRMMNPGTSNESITEMLGKVAEEYGCECLEGVLSHELRQFVIDGENTILAKPSVDRQVERFELEPNKVYAMDIVMSSGSGRGIRKEVHDTTIYKRVVENSYQLRSKASRGLLSTINNNFPTYPFSLRSFSDNMNRTRAGLVECLTHELLADYPVLHEKDGEYIAQFKFTCVVRPNQGPLRLCADSTFDTSTLPEHNVQNQDILEILQKKWQNPKRKKRKKKKKKSQAQSQMDMS